MTVEHVHVYEGGQAIVGNVQAPRGGDRSKSKDQPDAKQLTDAPQQTVWCADPPRDTIPVARDEERPLQDARRPISRSTEGK